jgi:hypothetical protein
VTCGERCMPVGLGHKVIENFRHGCRWLDSSFSSSLSERLTYPVAVQIPGRVQAGVPGSTALLSDIIVEVEIKVCAQGSCRVRNPAFSRVHHMEPCALVAMEVCAPPPSAPSPVVKRGQQAARAHVLVS